MAQAVPTDTPSSFIAKLLAPITEPVQNRMMRAEFQRDAEEAWSIALHRVHAFRAAREQYSHLRRVAQLEARHEKVPEAMSEQNAQLALLTAVDRLMHVPAPSKKAVRQKQLWRTFDGGRDRWEVAIAADLVRLQEKR